MALPEELRHVGSRLRFARIGGQPKSFHHQAERVLMLVECRGFICLLRKLRADRNPRHVSTSVSLVTIKGLVESDDQQSAVLEGTALDEWSDILLQPGVSGRQRTIMCVVAQIRGDERIIGEVAARQIS